MGKTVITLLGTLTLLGIALAVPLSDDAFAQVQSLRGESGIEEISVSPRIYSQDTGERFTRNFRQQPPLIPHKTDKYEIDLKVNQCLRCHDWPFNVKENAPKISETHYTNRDGVALDQVSRTRWFCEQCHVPQVNAKPLVVNNFEPAKGLR